MISSLHTTIFPKRYFYLPRLPAPLDFACQNFQNTQITLAFLLLHLLLLPFLFSTPTAPSLPTFHRPCRHHCLDLLMLAVLSHGPLCSRGPPPPSSFASAMAFSVAMLVSSPKPYHRSLSLSSPLLIDLASADLLTDLASLVSCSSHESGSGNATMGGGAGGTKGGAQG